MKFISAYQHRKLPGIDCSIEDSVTKQSFKDECDINNIMARYEKTGLLDYVNQAEPHYGDVSSFDFQTAMDTVALGRSLFEGLPGELRSRFENDPAKFLAFVEDPLNDEAAIQLGIKTRQKAPEATPAAPSGPTPSEPVAIAPAPV